MWAILHLQLQHQLLTQWTRIIILTAYRFIVFNFYILLWGRVIKYTMIIYMNLSRLEWNTCVSYCSKKWQITQEMIYVATARWNAYWNKCNLSYTLIWLICCGLSTCEIFGEFLSLYCLIVLMNDFINKWWNIYLHPCKHAS